MKRAVWVQKTLIFSTILGIMAAWDCLQPLVAGWEFPQMVV